MKNIKIALLGLSFFFAILLFNACKQQDNENVTVPNQTELQNKYVKEIDYLTTVYGFEKKDIEVLNEKIVVEKDIAFDVIDFFKKYELQSVQDTGITLRTHYYQGKKISVSKAPRLILLSVSPNVPSYWKSSIISAVNAWNGLNGSIMFSVQTASSNNISIAGAINVTYGGNLGYGVIAQGSPVSNGNAGLSLIINTNSGITPTESVRIKNIVHEIGHCIGLFHTDGNYGYLMQGGNISSSCSRNSDPNSVMRQGLNNWVGFTECDKQAFYYLYKR